MPKLTDIYDIPSWKRMRGKAKEGWVRPTVSQFLTTMPHFYHIQSIRTYFGDSRDGSLETTGNVSFSSTTDGDTVYKYFDNLVINPGHTVTVANRCKGLVIYCEGDCYIGGTLTMTARGCVGAGEYFAPNGLNEIETTDGVVRDLTIPPTGGAAHGYVTSTRTGNSASNGACGGGGSGKVDTGYAGGGGAGTTWCGGAGGGGGLRAGSTSYVHNGSSTGGAGGQASRVSGTYNDWSVGGGAGNPGGAGNGQIDGITSWDNLPYSTKVGRAGSTGAGGLLILCVKGDLTIAGSVTSNGTKGGTAYAPGGSSGGGGITILYHGEYTKTGSISTAGGAASRVTGYGAGGAGGSGSLRIYQVK
jgi:hypothetical protein